MIGVPIEAIREDAYVAWNHIDGPLLSWAGHIHWLTLRERAALLFGRTTVNGIAQKRWQRDDCIARLPKEST